MCTCKSGYAGYQYNCNDKEKIVWKIISNSSSSYITANMDTVDGGNVHVIFCHTITKIKTEALNYFSRCQ